MNAEGPFNVIRILYRKNDVLHTCVQNSWRSVIIGRKIVRLNYLNWAHFRVGGGRGYMIYVHVINCYVDLIRYQ